MPSQPNAAILPVTLSQAAEYLQLFANRRAYVRQSHIPDKDSGRTFYYQARDRKLKQPVAMEITTVRSHLAGYITIGLYAINPRSQSSK
jgi:hypothetical protein